MQMMSEQPSPKVARPSPQETKAYGDRFAALLAQSLKQATQKTPTPQK